MACDSLPIDINLGYFGVMSWEKLCQPTELPYEMLDNACVLW